MKRGPFCDGRWGEWNIETCTHINESHHLTTAVVCTSYGAARSVAGSLEMMVALNLTVILTWEKSSASRVTKQIQINARHLLILLLRYVEFLSFGETSMPAHRTD